MGLSNLDQEDERRLEQNLLYDADPLWSAIRVRPSIPKKVFPGSKYLTGATSTEILERLYHDDPLDIGTRCAHRLRRRAILIDPWRVFPVAVARMAHDALTYDGAPPIEVFADQCIDRAVRIVLDRDAADEERGIPPDDEGDLFVDHLSMTLNIERPLVRPAMLYFHTLPNSIRQAFKAMFMDGKTIVQWSREGHGSILHIKDQITYAIETIASLGKTELQCPDPPSEEDDLV